MPGPPWWRGQFKNAGFRLTLPRQAVLNVLTKTRRHLSAEEIFFLVHRNYPGIGLATVYRTLDLLSSMNLVLKFDFGEGRSRYELAGKSGKRYHQHLVCVRCGRIIDFSDFPEKEKDFVRELEIELSRRYEFKINSHRIYFHGICKKCQ